jgi:ABC-type transport system involved in multi-copper enzyme maturation permease subunit
MIIHFLLFFLVVLVVSQLQLSLPGFSIKKLYQFPNIWQFFPWVASWFNLFLAIVVILLVGNEFSHRTFRQNVIDGLSRNDLIRGKLILIFSIAVYTFLMVFIAIMIFGFINSDDYGLNAIFGNSYLLLIYFVQALGYMILGLLITVIFRNNALSIIMFILYFFPIEPIIRLIFEAPTRRYFPIKIISNLTPMPEFLTMTSENTFTNEAGNSALDLQEIGLTIEPLSVGLNVGLAVIFIIVFISITTLLLNKKSL